jgi:hypothetical protein
MLLGVAAGSAHAAGGPVILGGDDMTDHGYYDTGSGTNQQGWLYIQRALENLDPNVTRTNDNSVAALGSAPSSGDFYDAGGAIGRAAAAAGLTVTYYNGSAAIDQFFDDLRAGTATPAIVWIAGDGAYNDLADSGGTEAAALESNATTIGDFVNDGGGLLSHGSSYGWLSGLFPGALAVFNSGSSLELTADGMAAFPGLTNSDINAGPWHNHFEGDLGGLKTLATDQYSTDSSGNPARVIIGGAAVVLPGSISLDPPSDQNPVGTDHTVTADVRNGDGSAAVGETVTFTVKSGPNAGDTDTDTTDSDGKATFTWTGDGGAGTDTVEASFVDDKGTTQTATATKTWTAPEGPFGSASCSNGIDDDADGATDSADSGCAAPSGEDLCFGQAATITGNGTVSGTNGDDVIITGNGNDVVDGKGGNDRICTRGGDDYVRGGAGNDRINSGNGNDNTGGQAGDDIVQSTGGDDDVQGGDGRDHVQGGEGNDTLNGGNEVDALEGQGGNDLLAGNAGSPDYCDGGDGTDKATTNGGCETLVGIP